MWNVRVRVVDDDQARPLDGTAVLGALGARMMMAAAIRAPQA
jgi:hypothetical protein